MRRSVLLGRVEERGWRHVLVARSRNARVRLEPLARALAATAPTARILGLEVERAVLERTTGLPARDVDAPGVILYTAPGVPPGVAVHSTVAEPERRGPTPLDARSVSARLDGLVSKAPKGCLVALRRVEIVASALTLPSTETLVLEPVTRLAVPIITDGRRRYAAGPLDADGQRMRPPLSMRFTLDNEETELVLEVFWSPWSAPGSPGRTEVEKMLDRIRSVGFA